MAVVTHGVSANTADRILIDAGAVYYKATDDWTVNSPGRYSAQRRAGMSLRSTGHSRG